MISRRAFCPAALAGLAACRPRRGSGFPGYALVADEEGKSLAAVDLTAFALRRRIALGTSPVQVLAGRERASAYVLSSQPGMICHIDARAFSVTKRLRLAPRLVSMRLSPAGDALWVLAGEPPQLLRVSATSFQPELRIALPAEPAEFDLSGDGRLAAVTHGAGLVSLLDLTEGRVRQTVSTGESAGAVCFRRDGKLALVADPKRSIVAALRTEDCRVLTRLQIAVQPRCFRFKPDGGELFISGDGMDAVVVLNPYRTEVAETVLAGRTPGAMAFSRSPEFLFITNSPTGDVTVLDPETRRVIAVVAVGAEPSFVTITPDDGYALILNRRDGSMAVVRPRICGARPRPRRAALHYDPRRLPPRQRRGGGGIARRMAVFGLSRGACSLAPLC